MTPRLPGARVMQELWRVAPVPLSLSAMVRAAVATGAPLLAAHVFQEPGLFWMTMGGFLGTLADREGSYRVRAINLAAVAAAIATAGVLASLLGHGAVRAVTGMLIWGGVTAFLRVYGAVGANIGLTGSVVFAVSLGMPLGLVPALERGAWLLAGGAWAGLVTLVVWPLRPQLPARVAVARCYRALSTYASEIEELARRGDGEHGPAGRCFDAVRRALEEGWGALDAGWPGRTRRRDSKDRLLGLLETADQMLGTLVALSDVAERLPDMASRAALAEELRTLAGYTAALASAVERTRRPLPPAPKWNPLAPASAAGGASGERAALARAEEILRTLRTLSGTAGELLAGSHHPVGKVPQPPSGATESGRWLDPLRANLSGDSLLMRHALRVGISTGLAVAVSRSLDLELGHWVTLTVVFVLQPTAGTTLVKGMQRVLGTALGAVAAAVLARAIGDPVVLLVLLSGLAAAAVVTLHLNYVLFTFFVTPTFVLLAELRTGMPDLAGPRVVNTLIGGALAVAGARLIWSLPERKRFPVHAAAALRAARAFLLAVADAPRSPAGDPQVAALRRKLGLEVINAGESLQRLGVESGRASQRAEVGHTTLVYLRRLVSALVSFATAPPTESEAVRRFVADAEAALAALAEAIASGHRPPPLPSLVDAAWPPQTRSDVERIDRPLRMLHALGTRLADLQQR